MSVRPVNCQCVITTRNRYVPGGFNTTIEDIIYVKGFKGIKNGYYTVTIEYDPEYDDYGNEYPDPYFCLWHGCTYIPVPRKSDLCNKVANMYV